jgi:hypothetical protein
MPSSSTPPIRNFLPRPRPAVVMTVDDVFPGKRQAPFEAGGELEKGALGRLLWLLTRHPKLRLTLFVTPDWREVSPVPSSPLRHIPWLRDRCYLAPILPKGSMDLRRHPAFVSFLNALPRTEIGLHGLHHIHRGKRIAVEFQQQDVATCAAMMAEAIGIFEGAGLRFSRGLQPPGWNLPPALRAACAALGVEWVTSGRDLRTRVQGDAMTAEGFGLQGSSLVFPQRTQEGLLHFPTNFQATSPAERAFEILDAGGILSVKAHITKQVPGHTHFDGVDRLYMNYLDRLFHDIEDRYGDDVAWTTMGEIAAGLRGVAGFAEPRERPQVEPAPEAMPMVETPAEVVPEPRRAAAA